MKEEKLPKKAVEFLKQRKYCHFAWKIFRPDVWTYLCYFQIHPNTGRTDREFKECCTIEDWKSCPLNPITQIKGIKGENAEGK